jgi:tRNA(fMet)-specific endonuclease VapC
MTYFFDTNACIALIKGSNPQVRNRFQSVLATNARLLVSSIVVFELWYGVAKSVQKEKNKTQLEAFLAAPIEVISFDEEDAISAGEHRAMLEAIGRPISAYDLLIAGQALRRGWTLVTANVSEFSRVKGLSWEDWTRT